MSYICILSSKPLFYTWVAMENYLSGTSYLQQIVTNTAIKKNFQVILTGTNSHLETSFVPPLDLNGSTELALVSLETYFSFPNIDDTNNRIKVFLNDSIWADIRIPIGCYELDAINKDLQRQIQEKGGKQNDVTLSPNKNTLRCAMVLGETVEVDFTGANSLRTVLGFEAKVYTEKRSVSTHVVDIMKVNSILVHCDLIGSSYLNSSQQPIIFSFFPDVSPGEKIVMHPTTLIYLPVALDIIPRMTVWLTDQDNRPLNLRGEKLTLRFHIR